MVFWYTEWNSSLYDSRRPLTIHAGGSLNNIHKIRNIGKRILKMARNRLLEIEKIIIFHGHKILCLRFEKGH
jgi:hypothetical protein